MFVYINLPINMGKKILLLVALSAAFTFSGFAQSSGVGNFNVGAYGALPLSNMRQIFHVGFGGSLNYEYHYRNDLFFTLGAGYEAFDVKTELQNAYVPSTYSYIPVKAGVKYYFIKGFYGEFQLGTSIYAQHGGGSAFDYAPGIGYSFKSGFEVGLHYEEWTQKPQNHIEGDYGMTGPFKTSSTFSQLALRVAERF
jgi:hypothetical protein